MERKKKDRRQQDVQAKSRRIQSSYTQPPLKEKEQNTIGTKELGTKLKTIKEEYIQEEAAKSSIVELRGPKPSWIKKQPEVDTKQEES